MRTLVISHLHPLRGGAEPQPVVDLEAQVPEEFAAVIEWLVRERLMYQERKWDYAHEDFEHAVAGLTEDSWFWGRGVLNYVGRVRMCQRGAEADGNYSWYDNPIAIQAILKLTATMGCIPEHLLRGGAILELPKAGVPSGEV